MPKREREYKPLLFTTTLRNPMRTKQLLYLLKKYDGKILDDKLAVDIVGELIKYGVYRPMKQIDSVKTKWKTTPKGQFSDYILTDQEVKTMMKNNPQDHKEAGFDYGYPSRFATIFDFTKEMGFVYYNQDEPIFFSEIGKRLASVLEVTLNGDEICVDEIHPEYEQEVFLQALSKSQRKNPFVRVLNDNIPLILLLQTIKLLNSDKRWNNAGISRRELPLLIFWKDNDAKKLYDRICEIRTKYRYQPSEEVIIDICTKEIMEGKMKKFDAKSIVVDYPDEFIRKMRMTGLISLRGAGRFVDINHLEDKKVEYILSNYAKYDYFEDDQEREYFDYMSKIDQNLISQETKVISSTQSEELLIDWTKTYDWSVIKTELNILADSKASSDEVLKFLVAPVRLEFLTALAIKSRLPEVRVIPNYKCDDTGLPTSTAGGGVGDIECIEHPNGILVEVTMAEGRQQTMMEIWPIERHLIAFREKYYDNSQCVFVAPSIYNDSRRQIEYVKATSNGANTIRPYAISEFIDFLENANKLYA